MFIYKQIETGADEQVAMAAVRSEVLSLAAKNGRAGAEVTVGIFHRIEPTKDSWAWAAYVDGHAETAVGLPMMEAAVH